MRAPAHRKLKEPMTVYRIGDPGGAFPINSAEGARRVTGRWHRKGQAVICTGAHYSTAMLERLVHYSGRLPGGQHFIEITIPAGTVYEVVTSHSLPGWEHKDGRIARGFGARWIDEVRSAILIVPSVVARMERNVLINPAHGDAARIKPGLETPITWDARLFSPPP
jgi:RES domain-containing protein